MIHMTDITASPFEKVTILRPAANLGQLVRDQLSALTASGYAQVDVRWNSDMLLIDAKSDDGYVCRVFNADGACVMEQIDRRGIGVERHFEEDGITVISEEIFGESEDR
ncbi:hypothetical protein QKW60_19410 [Defluviimonas aestuarii]|jgi:hypothetical protein|uniref:hypothetical protein n=1 Tax=Albidovulum aestuarii TaxID=1130726 RepID=UPI00249CEE40|nr:hypothetical protein [Defluviimonas aestuarii]MDI3338585.1 hypothetical protein [Defluviimonas aestuarii]